MSIQKNNAAQTTESNSSFNNSMGLTTKEIQMKDAQARMQAQAAEWAAKTIAKEAITKALQAANPHLKAGSDCVTAAKNIRIELKKAFPQIKFSVTTSKFAGGDSVRIGYTDGVTSDEVEAITGKYSGGSFNSSDDSYSYSDSAWTDSFGSSKYVSVSRHYSLEFVQVTINKIAAEFHDGEIPTAADYRNGKLYSVQPSRHCEDWQHLIYRAMVKTTA